MTPRTSNVRLVTLGSTVCALIAFAANSVLCRLALQTGEIDPASFTLVRLLSGALVLAMLLKLRGATDSQPASTPQVGHHWLPALMLFIYAVTFSFAYVSLDTGTGALVLFGCVQLTIIISGLLAGNRLLKLEWIGLIAAFCGLVYLVLPAVSSPSVTGFILMSVAGIAWGIYTLKGRGSTDPLRDTTHNFLRAMPLAVGLILISLVVSASTMISVWGAMLAVLSGALASGVGYAIWYTALRGLSTTESAVVQLAVPALAAFGGVLFVAEPVSQRLIIASVLTLGGILLVILAKRYLGEPKIEAET